MVLHLRSHPVSSIRYFELPYEGGRRGGHETQRRRHAEGEEREERHGATDAGARGGEARAHLPGTLPPPREQVFVYFWLLTRGWGTRERKTTGGQAHCGGRVRWGDAAQGGDGTRRGGGMPTKRSVFEGGALPWSGRWCMEEKGK